jgi:hypothetical protein
MGIRVSQTITRSRISQGFYAKTAKEEIIAIFAPHLEIQQLKNISPWIRKYC